MNFVEHSFELAAPPPACFTDLASQDGLVWLEGHGIGYCAKVMPSLYGVEYFEEFQRRDASPMGGLLTKGRLEFVRMALDNDVPHGGDLVDVGIGGGRFVREARCAGYDINPSAAMWLKKEGRWRNLLRESCQVATFWDSLEHIHDPQQILANVHGWAFISTPIYLNLPSVLASRHYKPGEHCWYWTVQGMRSFMAWHGFKLVAHSRFESDAGRDSIMSFAFVRAVREVLS